MLRVLLLGLSISGDSPLFVLWEQGDRKDPSDQREDRINRCPKPRFGLRGLIGFRGDAFTVIPRSKATWGSPFAWRKIATSGRALLAMTLTLSSRPRNDDTPSKPSSPTRTQSATSFWSQGRRGLIGFMGDAYTVIPRSEATWGSPFA